MKVPTKTDWLTDRVENREKAEGIRRVHRMLTLGEEVYLS